ncbi:MAG: GIY-YIG nuclease family protein [Promethearchaeota archaeon]|jgi:putative endonuclease
MSVFYVYILNTIGKNNKRRFYTGYTNDLYRRLEEHKAGKGARFTKGKKKIELKYVETYVNRKEAMKRELEIKTYSRKEKAELIKSFKNS